MPSYSEKGILEAIKDVESGISQRKAAQRWGIPKTTLHDRLNSTVNKYDAQEHTQRLSRQLETHLVQWILAQEALGLAPLHQQVREFASRVIKAGGDDVPLGKAWMEGFLRRNPEVRTVRGKPLDSCRLNGATTKINKAFLSVFSSPFDPRDLPRPPFQHGRDRAPRRSWKQRASARERRTQGCDEETTWLAMLDYNRRAYLSNRSGPYAAGHLQGLECAESVVSIRS